MAETTSPEIASLASKGLDDPSSLTPDQIKSVCASALSQAPDRSYGPDDESHGEAEAEARGAATAYAVCAALVGGVGCNCIPTRKGSSPRVLVDDFWHRLSCPFALAAAIEARAKAPEVPHG